MSQEKSLYPVDDPLNRPFLSSEIEAGFRVRLLHHRKIFFLREDVFQFGRCLLDEISNEKYPPIMSGQQFVGKFLAFLTSRLVTVKKSSCINFVADEHAGKRKQSRKTR